MERLTTYEKWIREEGIPIMEGYSVEDLRDVPREPWARTGGKGAFIQLRGMEGFTGMYLAEIPQGGALNPLKHLYDEIIYVLKGHGATEVWWGKDNGKKVSFEWTEGGVFAVPLNATYRLHNGSQEPVLYLAVTSAPPLMDLLHDPEFIFGCENVFEQRFDGRADYFVPTNKRSGPMGGFWIWESNFIADVKGAILDPAENKGAGVRLTILQMGDSSLVGHIAEWPVGRYHKAHHHQGGAILLILRSQGYTLMWPPEAGVRPYHSGNGDKVIKVNWKEGSVFSPPTGWFHQHINTGRFPAQQLAFRYNTQSGPYRLGIGKALNKKGVVTSIREGGTLIEYEDEDPQIRTDFATALEAEGVTFQMPPVQYHRQG
ncbi:MAG: ethanolamine ammonia lyase-activating protein [Candidatus Binatia bacterium]